MQKQKNYLGKDIVLARLKILDYYLAIIEDTRRENRSQLKQVGHGTGTGKTHQLFEAICKTIESYANVQIIGIYIAPLIEHLQAPDSIKKRYPDIPIYRINSLDMKMTDEYIKLYGNYADLILKNKSFWKISSKKCSQEKIQNCKDKLQKIKKLIQLLEFLKNEEFGDEEFNSKRTKTVWKLNNLLKSFVEFLIKYKDEDSWTGECLKLVKIFFPLHLLREKSGILMLTYKKFETKIPCFNHNGETWVRKERHLDVYVKERTNGLKKFIIAFDEQEDGYNIMLKEKIDIVTPQQLAINNALSSIYREFAIIFSTQNNENCKFLSFVEKNNGVLQEFQEHFETGKTLEQKLQVFAPAYDRLINVEANSINFLEQVVAIKRGLEKSKEDILKIINDYNETNPIALKIETFARVFSKFENNRSLVISRQLYNKVSDELTNIFSYNNLYIYNIEPLKNLFVTSSSGGHVRITDQEVADCTSLAELVYAIFAIRQQIKAIKGILFDVLEAEDSQSRSLNIWSRQIAKIQ